MRFTFTTLILGSDPESALVSAAERARWSKPDDPDLTPEVMALALKTEHVLIERPARVPASRVLAWLDGTEQPPVAYLRVVRRCRRLIKDPAGPVVILPLSYREETEVLQGRGLTIGHGYHRPFAGYALGTVIADLPKKLARRPGVTAA